MGKEVSRVHSERAGGRVIVSAFPSRLDRRHNCREPRFVPAVHKPPTSPIAASTVALSCTATVQNCT